MMPYKLLDEKSNDSSIAKSTILVGMLPWNALVDKFNCGNIFILGKATGIVADD